MLSVSTTFLTICTLLACKEIKGHCSLPFPGFIKEPSGLYLRNHVVRSIALAIEDVCRIHCYLADNCMSYNYHPVSGVCDINDSDHIQDPNDLVKQDGYIYVGTENGCTSKPCAKNSGCKSSVKNPLYHQCSCQPDSLCKLALGMESGEIKNIQITASSIYSTTRASHKARLNKSGCWLSSGYGAKWLQVDLLNKTKITGIATQGCYASRNHFYVKKYQVKYSDDDRDFVVYENGKELAGNSDGLGTVVRQELKPAIFARFIRIHATKTNYPVTGLKMELYGCDC